MRPRALRCILGAVQGRALGCRLGYNRAGMQAKGTPCMQASHRPGAGQWSRTHGSKRVWCSI
eukprot:12010664-Alexandrium_andersonii.AAC.1